RMWWRQCKKTRKKDRSASLPLFAHSPCSLISWCTFFRWVVEWTCASANRAHTADKRDGGTAATIASLLIPANFILFEILIVDHLNVARVQKPASAPFLPIVGLQHAHQVLGTAVHQQTPLVIQIVDSALSPHDLLVGQTGVS